MELSGYPYTWEKGKGIDQWVEVRLDRALISQSWNLLFPIAKLENLEVTVSDHCPILLELGIHKRNYYAKRFRFENAWGREPLCKQIVKENWADLGSDPLYEKIKCCSTALAEWGKEITGNFKGRIAECNRVLKRLKGRRDEGSVMRTKEAESKLLEVLTQKELF